MRRVIFSIPAAIAFLFVSGVVGIVVKLGLGARLPSAFSPVAAVVVEEACRMLAAAVFLRRRRLADAFSLGVCVAAFELAVQSVARWNILALLASALPLLAIHVSGFVVYARLGTVKSFTAAWAVLAIVAAHLTWNAAAPYLQFRFGGGGVLLAVLLSVALGAGAVSLLLRRSDGMSRGAEAG